MMDAVMTAVATLPMFGLVGAVFLWSRRALCIALLLSGALHVAPTFAAPLTTKPNTSNTVSQCLANVPVVGNGAGISPVCYPNVLGTFNSGTLLLKGGTSGTLTMNAAAVAGTNTITWPAGTTDFSATGGTSQVVKQTSSGGAFTVARLACSDLSDGASGCSGSSSAGGANPSATLGLSAVNGSALTFLRSDGAPALSQAIVPTWSGIHTFSAAPVFNALPTGTAVATANTPSTIVVRNGSGDFSAGTITASLTGHASLDLAISALGTGVQTALGVNVGTAGAPVVNGGALGTLSSGTLTNATGLPVSTGLTGAGTGVLTALGVNVGSAGAFVTNGGALGTPSAGVANNLTGTASGLTAGNVIALASGLFSNPSASAGLTAVNGTATTAMRSDAAPAISQAIAPTWTGQHTFGSAGYPTKWSGTGSGDVIQIGGASLNSSATPDSLNLGGDYSSTAGANPKIKLLGVAGSVYGIGVSAGFMEFAVPSTAAFSFYPNGSGSALASVTTVGDFRSTPRAVAALGTCNAGAEGTRAGVTDATAPVALATVSGGGAVHVGVYCNGTNWIVQ